MRILLFVLACLAVLAAAGVTWVWRDHWRWNTGVAVTDVRRLGAKGDCVADDTAAVQKAILEASKPGGSGVVYFPPVRADGCYRVTKLDATAKAHLTFLGSGARASIKVSGKDSANNWLDLSCSNDIALERLHLIQDGSSVPDNIILWGWCGKVFQSGLFIDRVNMDVSFVKSALYAYGYSGGGALSSEGNSSHNGGGLVIRDSTWYGRHGTGNGAQTDPSLRSALLHLHARNNLGVASAYQTLGGEGLAWSALLENVNLIDAPAGYGGAHRDNNAVLVCYTCGAQLVIRGGSIQCLCETPFVAWHFPEGIHLTGTRVGAADQSAGTVLYAFRFGGPPGAETIGNITLDSFFLAGAVDSAGAIIGQQNPGPVGGANQAIMARFRVISPEIGQARVPLIAPTGLACTLDQTPISNWIGLESRLDMVGLSAIFCGSVDFSTALNNPGPIRNSNPGVQRTGCQYRIAAGMSCGVSTEGGP